MSLEEEKTNGTEEGFVVVNHTLPKPNPCPICGAEFVTATTIQARKDASMLAASGEEPEPEKGLTYVVRPYYGKDGSFLYGIRIACEVCGFTVPETAANDPMTESDLEAAIEAWNEAGAKKTEEVE